MFNTSWHDKNWAFYASLQHKLDHLLTTSKSCPVVLFPLGTYKYKKIVPNILCHKFPRYTLSTDVLFITFWSRLQKMFISTEKTKDFVSNFRLFYADKTCIHSLLLSYQVSGNVDLLILILVVFNLSSFLMTKMNSTWTNFSFSKTDRMMRSIHIYSPKGCLFSTFC